MELLSTKTLNKLRGDLNMSRIIEEKINAMPDSKLRSVQSAILVISSDILDYETNQGLSILFTQIARELNSRNEILDELTEQGQLLGVGYEKD